jgi:hypothetical protein
MAVLSKVKAWSFVKEDTAVETEERVEGMLAEKVTTLEGAANVCR